MPNTTASPQELLSELLRRKQAKDGLLGYVSYLDVGIMPAAHHRLLISELEAVECGERQRLMVLMPPGSAKSTYASVLFPAWYLGRSPQRSIIAASYTEELAQRFGRRVRNFVASEAHRNVFNAGIAADFKSIGQWETRVAANISRSASAVRYRGAERISGSSTIRCAPARMLIANAPVRPPGSGTSMTSFPV